MFFRRKIKKNEQTISVSFREVKDSPRILGRKDFGDICGFNLKNCPYVERKGEIVPLLDGDNLLRVMDECRRLDGIVRDSGVKVPQFRTGYDGAVDITLHETPPTPTGKAQKYPVVVRIENQGSHIEPASWDEWIDAIAVSNPEDRKMFTDEAMKRDDSSYFASLYFLPDWSVGKADVYVWQDEFGFAFKFRMHGAALSLLQVQQKHIEDDCWATYYSSN